MSLEALSRIKYFVSLYNTDKENAELVFSDDDTLKRKYKLIKGV